jgi:hypothetical protein
MGKLLPFLPIGGYLKLNISVEDGYASFIFHSAYDHYVNCGLYSLNNLPTQAEGYFRLGSSRLACR